MENEIEIWYPEKKNGRTTFSKVQWSLEDNYWRYISDEEVVHYVLAPIRNN